MRLSSAFARVSLTAAAALPLGACSTLGYYGHLVHGEVSLLAARKPVARIPGAAHGTGCTLASAIAANLALGDSLIDAVGKAIEYVHRALAAGYRPGRGNLRVLDHLNAARSLRKL